MDANQPANGGAAGAGGANAQDILHEMANTINRDDENMRDAWVAIRGLEGDCSPDFNDFKVCGQHIKRKEVWTVARIWSKDYTKTKVKPIHLFVAMGAAVEGPATAAIMTIAQRDEYVSKFMLAQTSLSYKDACIVAGQTLMDTKDVGQPRAGTTYQGRFRRWIETDMENLWRDNYRRQERLVEEAKERAEERERERADDLRQRQANNNNNNNYNNKGKGRFNRKGQQPYGKGSKGKPKGVCYNFLQGTCTFGNRCRFLHPSNTTECTEADFTDMQGRIESLKNVQYGSWLQQEAQPAA